MKFKASVFIGICSVGIMEMRCLSGWVLTKGFSVPKIYQKSYSLVLLNIYSLLKPGHCEGNLTIS